VTGSTPSIVTLQEYQKCVIDCDAATAAHMHAEGHVTVSPLDQSRHEVRAKHKVGVLRYDGLELRIRPKVPISRLLYLATFRDDPSAWHDLDTAVDEAPDLLSAVGWAFVHHAERCLRPAPLQGYVTREESHRHLRGRILFEQQLSRRSGLTLPLELRYDDYELGIVENRAVKAALLTLLRIGGPKLLTQRLRHLCGLLDGVEPWPGGVPVPDINFNRLNEPYRPAVALSRLILGGRSLEFGDRRHPGSAFLFDMNKVFESYLEAALSSAVARYGGSVQPQHRLALDENEQIVMKPDLTWHQNGSPQAVIDAKYKRATNTDFPNADAYQMLAYCTALGLRRGHLVYADLDGDQPGTSRVRNTDIELIVTAIDLSADVEDLKAGVHDLAAEIARSSPRRTVIRRTRTDQEVGSARPRSARGG
jgi:5-methylcytosine-specific restriction enzyme subunit McrC